MQETILNDLKMPYCPGCGHTVANKSMSKALVEMGVHPLDVIVVSDIGCTGLVDPLLTCHTIHGLHGRAVALAMGIRMGLEHPDKKIIALQGDGGATIGLQHLLEAARHNLDLTLVVQNNMVYGMTGGQTSGLSSTEFKEPERPEAAVPGYDICALAHNAGAAYTARTFIGKDTAELWKEALSTPGFSLIEIVEMCPAYGLRKVQELHDVSDYESVVTRNRRSESHPHRFKGRSLLDGLKPIEHTCEAPLEGRLEIIVAGSAGEAIQSAGDLLSTAGITAGLSATKKGDYPITIGTGVLRRGGHPLPATHPLHRNRLSRHHDRHLAGRTGQGAVPHRRPYAGHSGHEARERTRGSARPVRSAQRGYPGLQEDGRPERRRPGPPSPSGCRTTDSCPSTPSSKPRAGTSTATR